MSEAMAARPGDPLITAVGKATMLDKREEGERREEIARAEDRLDGAMRDLHALSLKEYEKKSGPKGAIPPRDARPFEPLAVHWWTDEPRNEARNEV